MGSLTSLRSPLQHRLWDSTVLHAAAQNPPPTSQEDRWAQAYRDLLWYYEGGRGNDV